MTITEKPPQAQASPGGLFGRPVVVAGCHGGAGTTILARLCGAVDGRVWVPQRMFDPVVLVARGTPHGMDCVAIALAHGRRVDVVPAALVVVGDGPWPMPRLAADRLALVRDLVPAVVHVPYVIAWRYVPDPLTQRLPKPVVHAVNQLAKAVWPDFTRR